MLSNGKKHYPEDSSIGFRNIYPLDSGLSGDRVRAGISELNLRTF